MTLATVTGSIGSTWLRRIRTHMDMAVFLGLLTVLNLHLFGIAAVPLQVFTPGQVAGGQWWRILTHPLVHVSWYHLLLDAGAFVLLYTGLDNRRTGWKLFCAGLCAGGSLAGALLFVPRIDALGLCGLSGAAHGLMAYSGLEMMEKNRGSALGLLSFWLVAGKSLREMITGQVMFEFMHMGLCGTALAPCHLGGVAGGITAFLIVRKLS